MGGETEHRQRASLGQPLAELDVAARGIAGMVDGRHQVVAYPLRPVLRGAEQPPLGLEVVPLPDQDRFCQALNLQRLSKPI